MASLETPLALVLVLVPFAAACTSRTATGTSTALDPCAFLPDGRACGAPAPSMAGGCTAAICAKGRCTVVPVPDDRRCRDTDFNPCTIARCVPGQGVCRQDAVQAANGTACGPPVPNDCRRNVCLRGRCIATPDSTDVPNVAMDQPASVEVTMQDDQLVQATATTNCCPTDGCGGPVRHLQTLEALAPSPAGPIPPAPGGPLPRRATVCGEVRAYGVTDEVGDPRDLEMDIIPSAAFADLVAGLRNTACTPLDDGSFDVGRDGDGSCDVAACRHLTREDVRLLRCIHAEVTPAQQFYGEDDVFLRIDTGGSCADGQSGCVSALEPSAPGRAGRTACVHGPYVYDHGNDHGADHRNLCCVWHRDHEIPEIHPMDAVWWNHPSQTGWVFAVFQDDSNRYSAPYCSFLNNGNEWSRAPRDATFRFPFRFDRGQPVCARLEPATAFARGSTTSHRVLPLNVSTALLGPAVTGTENKVLRDGAGAVILEVRENATFGGETLVQVTGCSTPDVAAGVISVRVAVGCAACSRAQLAERDPGGRQDGSDLGSGFYYGQLTFVPGPCP